jgi:hypothetical protein
MPIIKCLECRAKLYINFYPEYKDRDYKLHFSCNKCGRVNDVVYCPSKHCMESCTEIGNEILNHIQAQHDRDSEIVDTTSMFQSEINDICLRYGIKINLDAESSRMFYDFEE